MRFNPWILLILLSVCLAAASQILLKMGARQKHESALREYLNPWVIGGYGLLVLTTLINIVAYSHGVELKSGAIMETLGLVLIMLFSRALFGERIGKRKLIGTALIVVGIVVFYL